jgi:hypothetical protein
MAVPRSGIIAAAVAVVAIALVVLYLSVPERAPTVQGHHRELRGTSLGYSVPSAWDDNDHSSCNQPCVRLRLLPDGNGGVAGPSITLQRVSAGSRSTPFEYAKAQVAAGQVATIRVGGRSGVEFALSGDAIVDAFDSQGRWQSGIVQVASRHIIFQAERRLYECVIEGNPQSIAEYRAVFLTFCASVTEL